MTKSLRLFAGLLLSLSTTSCQTFQASDFEIMIQLPASHDCYGVQVMSGTEHRYSAAECVEMLKRAIILTSKNWKMVRSDISTNCQYDQCNQITGAGDGLFLAIDQALNKMPFQGLGGVK
jgi:hypothetical protein